MSIASKHRARLKTIAKEWTPFVQITITAEMKSKNPLLAKAYAMYQNSRYNVIMFSQATELGAFMQCDIRAHLSEREPTWHEMQRIKNELFSPNAIAFEVFPAEAIAWRANNNVRVMWVAPTNFELKFGLHLPTAWGGVQ